MCDTAVDPDAVHCPHCGVDPGQPCRSPSGKPRIGHGQRLQLATALASTEVSYFRAEAERYRMRWPEVEVREIRCSPSRAQVRWWAKWGRAMRYDRREYEREHGPDNSVPAEQPQKQDDSFVGQPVGEILDQLDQVKVKRKR